MTDRELLKLAAGLGLVKLLWSIRVDTTLSIT
jgi:hypothetical protein